MVFRGNFINFHIFSVVVIFNNLVDSFKMSLANDWEGNNILFTKSLQPYSLTAEALKNATSFVAKVTN